ncbi:hypothetical protein L7F22_046041 [Adiantum nelumboides]|nr:hypothetical protein [Adiantum nelumboides]
MVKLFMHNIFKYHGIHSCRCWKALFENICARLKFSSSFHPKTDGQPEEANSTVLDLLKCYVLEHKATWEHYLVEYAYNYNVHTSIGKAPFEIVEGGKKIPSIWQTKDKIFEVDKYVQIADKAYRKIKIALEKTQLYVRLRAQEWLLDGLCVFLTDMFIKRHFGNNEAYYRHFKANEAVCKADNDTSPPLSCSSLHGTQRFGVLSHLYSWKSVAVIHMLEKQMGPDAFRKILQRVILRAQDPVRKSRTLSAKEFRHFANRLGNLERPFLKEFFPRWVEFQGCPVLRMGFEYNKRRNMIELAVFRSCTASSEKMIESKGVDEVTDRAKGTDAGWPGMMSIRVHEIDGMYDHPSLPMSGDTYQLLEIQCHSKLAGRRFQRPKKGSKADGAEEAEQLATVDSRQSESPLLWLRADPQMEYLSDIQLQQPEQMWINQLEKDKDVVAQLQAIAALSSLSQVTFAVLNALNSCLTDSKMFFRVRIEAAFALSRTAKEVNGWIGLSHLLAFYKGHKFDPNMGLPRPNDFRDFPEYFVLEAVPLAVASVRGADGKSPPEAIEFILQLLKHNDNSGNQYSDVFWLSSIITSVASLEFSQQSIGALSRIIKCFDRFLQYDRIMPSYNHLLTRSCVQTLTKLALKFSVVLPLLSWRLRHRFWAPLKMPLDLVRTYDLMEEDEAKMQTAIQHFSGRTLVDRLMGTSPSCSTVREWIQSALRGSTGRILELTMLGRGIFLLQLTDTVSIGALLARSPISSGS